MHTTSSLKKGSASSKAAPERRPTSPGEILRDEFLEANNIKQHELSGAMGVSRFRINEVINGRRAITAETALLLAAALDTTPEFWLNLQRAVDLYDARVEIHSDLKEVRPLRRKSDQRKIFYDSEDAD